MLMKNRSEARQMDDNASQSSSSTSSLKAATSFVSSLSTKSWAVLSRKMKSATITKEGVIDKCDDVTGDHSISKTGSLKKTSSYGASYNNNASAMDCSPQQMVYKETIQHSNYNSNGYDDTASSVTLVSSSSLSMASSGNLIDSSNTLPSRMEVEEKIPSQKTESGFHSSTNSQSSLVSSIDTKTSKSSTTTTASAPTVSSNTSISQGDVNGRVESLVNKVLSPEAIKVINVISIKFDALSRTNVNEGVLSQDNNSNNKTLLFSGRKEPSVTLNAFLLRLVTLLNWVFDKNSENGKGLNSTGMRYLVISTLYIERALNMHPDLKITPLNIHRIFLGATVNAMTFFEDQIPDKTIMAKIGGVDEKQVRILGKRFFQFLDYRLWIDPTDYILYYKRICETVQISFEPEIPSWQL